MKWVLEKNTIKKKVQKAQRSLHRWSNNCTQHRAARRPSRNPAGRGRISYSTNQHALRDSKVVNAPKREKECKEARCDLEVGFMDCFHG